MSHQINILGAAALAAALLVPNLAAALNPQPEPPSRMLGQTKSLGGPDTKSGWKSFHDVEEKSKTKSKGIWKRFHEVDKTKGK